MGESGCGVNHFEDGTFEFLKVGDDFEEVFGLWIPGRAEHAHEGFWGAGEIGSELHEAHGAVDVFAEE